MEDIAVNCSWSDAHLERDTVLALRLPPELRTQILTSSGSEYLKALSIAARIPRCTDRIFVLYESVFVDLAARWVSPPISTLSEEIVTLSCLARLLPFVSHLRPLAAQVIARINLADLVHTANPTVSWVLPEEQLVTLLLSLFRLLSFDRDYFDSLIDVTFLSPLLHHNSLIVRYIAIVTLCQAMHLADAYEMRLIQVYVGRGLVLGKWEDKDIDFRLLKLWEEKRWKELEAENESVDSSRSRNEVRVAKNLSLLDLNAMVIPIGSTLVLRQRGNSAAESHFVSTPNAENSMQQLGEALLQKKSIQLTGATGSGKTSLVLEAARLSGKLESLIVLHLNEQTDAKSLLGLHTSSVSGEGFTWHPGVLTRAVQEGRWVLIEDIDRASAEVLGVLRPIIENGSVFIPSRKQKIRANEGFRLLSTVRTSAKMGGPNASSTHSWLSNKRLWNFVTLPSYDLKQMAVLISRLLPDIRPLVETIIGVHASISSLLSGDLNFRAAQNRSPSLRDLLKWCRRIDSRLHMHRLEITTHPIPESCQVDILRDALDCYASHLGDRILYHKAATSVAQAMNIAPQQLQHQLSTFLAVTETKQEVQVGRSLLSRISNQRGMSTKLPFASTSSAQLTIESISASITFAEPCLLVGETGVGKTSAIQYIANLVGQKLTVVNLSQQSEGTDLLGGLKPVTIRSLILPLVQQFDDLLDETFPNGNDRYKSAMSRILARQSWPRILRMWHEASQLANKSLRQTSKPEKYDGSGPTTKRRKVDRSRQAHLLKQWDNFSASVDQIQARVDDGDRTHTFTFVEGRLIQAIRNGEWLLLDEVNLATSDTLDYVASLLQEGSESRPFILLTEAGKAEKIEAHPNFRIFAAMNPATDIGKKDLAPSIRSRFTELYVQAGDRDEDDLIRIIQAYLGQILMNDKRAARDLAKAYLEVQSYNQDRKLTDGAGEPPHFSIRSLVRCLLYVIQHHVSHGLRRSMYEGFMMSFFTALSQESEKLIAPAVSASLLSGVKNIKSFLSQQPRMPTNEDLIAFRHHFISKGPIAINLQPHYIRTPSVERNLENLARAASMRRFPILLQGPTSSGKTSMIEYLAKLSGHKFVRINNHENTDLQEYLGSYASSSDGRLEFRDGVLVDALRQGHWLVLDELNLAPTDVLEALNRLLDDNRELLVPETQEVVRPHPKFMLFATQNPAGLYGGRKRLSKAFRNRFLEIHFDEIPESELETILKERSQIPASFCAQIVAVYKKLSFQRQSSRLFEHRNSFATLRDLFRWAARHVDDRQQLGNQGFMLLGERVRDLTEREIVRATIEETLRIKISDTTIYSAAQLTEEARSFTEVIWTAAMRRLFVLVSEALQNKEPVLLVGETGCGKTQICQVIAHAFGRVLNIYNAHTNTETGDLIGSQRPVRIRSQLAKEVLDSLQAASSSFMKGSGGNEETIDDLIARFDNVDSSTIDPQALVRVKNSIGAYRALFLWKDGSLVRAMKAGEHFLLDEISLADDSVLERLNSVLEPTRTILLAEKGSVDNVVTAEPGFQFLATMNPGGDYGKRELSAALRNRVTEIWVPALSQDEDVLPIMKSRLEKERNYLAPLMLKFAQWFGSTLTSATTNTIVLRDLLTWCSFVSSAKQLDSDVAFVHGASLVYIDSIGTSPTGVGTSHLADIHKARARSLEYLQTLVSTNVVNVYKTLPTLRIDQNCLVIEPFSIPRYSTNNLLPTGLVFDAPTTLRNTLRIMRGLQMDRPILLEGSPGVGKTAIVTTLAGMTGKSFTRINLSDQTDLMDLFGADAPIENQSIGTFSWKDGPLLKAMRGGEWILLDEMNLASQSVLEGLNSCLDHRKEVFVPELDKMIACHPDFRLFAAQNPHYQGGGRKGLPASFVSRFTVVYADPFTEEDLLTICRVQNPTTSNGIVQDIVHHVHALDLEVARNHTFGEGGPWEMNLRDVNRWLELSKSKPNVSPLFHYGTLVSHRFRNSRQREQISKTVGIGSLISYPQSLYNRLGHGSFQVGLSILPRAPFLQPASWNEEIPTQLLSPAQSIITAVCHRWPTILVGCSGSGKTQLLRSLAAIAGSRLIEISMNSDVDAMDLLGGFEQYDEGREVEQLKQNILSTLECHLERKLVGAEGLGLNELLALRRVCHDAETSLDSLRHALKSASAISIEAQPFTGQVDRFLQRTTSAARFVWNEGILVDAVKNGSWVVLDNANLCNASVLDRLNSLLEPNGSLIISEQHDSIDGTRAIVPHPDFRIFLTMDPRYGELSRAMRNRSLEIFLDPSKEALKPSRAIKYPFSSSVVSLRRAFEQSEKASSVRPAIDDLSLEDLAIAQSQSSSVKPADLRLRNAIDASTWENISQWLGFQVQTINGEISSLVGCQSAQQPLLNEPLIVQRIDCQSRKSIAPLAKAWDVVLETSKLRHDLKAATDNAISENTNKLTALQKSAFNDQNRKHNELGHIPLWIFLKSMAEALHEIVKNCAASNASPAHIQILMPIARYLRDIFHYSNAKKPDYARLQAYLAVGKDLCDGDVTATNPLSQILKTELLRFQIFRLKYGQSLQRMWQNWQPLTPSTTSELNKKLAFERTSEQFEFLSFGLPQKRKELLDVKLLVLRTCVSGWQQPSSDAVLDGMHISLGQLKSQSERRKPIWNHYQTVFDAIARRAIIELDSEDIIRIEGLMMFSGRGILVPTFSSSNSAADTLGKLESMTGYLDPGARSLSEHIVVQASKMPEQSYRAVDRLQEECKALAQVLCSQTPLITSDVLSGIEQHARTLLLHILEDHKAILLPDLTSTPPYSVDMSITDLSEENKYLAPIFQHHIQPAAALLLQNMTSVHRTHGSMYPIGAALVHVSLAALKLMVPDQPFDPALYPQLVQERYQTGKSDLLSKIDAQRAFNRNLMGQDSSLLLRIYEDQLEEFGKEPTFPAVARPEISELGKVQAEFQNVIRNIFERLPALNSAAGSSNDTETVDELGRMRANIDQIELRLSKMNRAYDDMIVPVRQLLKCLALGIELLLAASGPTKGNKIPPSLEHTPLLGATANQVLNWTPENGLNDGLNIAWLQHHALQRSITHAMNARNHQHTSKEYLHILDSFYERWKSQLAEAQIEEETKSRYYTYRNSEQDDDFEERELSAMFPDFDDSDNAEADLLSGQLDRQSLSLHLATIHERLFTRDVSGEDVRDHIVNVLVGARGHAASVENAMPGILLQVQREINSIHRDLNRQAINIYTETSIEEVQKLFALVQKILVRFFEISDRWPEHAIPLEVIAFSEEVLDFKLNSPLAKMLTKTEKLLAIISQWQSVASREWSVATLMEDLTALIISWRRMELRSWSRLLDDEKEKNDDTAKAWYFIAYEAVLYNSRRLVEDDEDVTLYCRSLTKTLEEFLRSTSVGQFSPRLRMLHILRETLDEVAGEDDRLSPVLTCLQNVLYHFSRYEAGIQKQINVKRADLEKAVTEQIKLASWKDTNVSALRDSAKRSHQKLFRIVKKYRALLGQPLTVLNAAEIEINSALQSVDNELLSWSSPGDTLENAIQECENRISGWLSRPARLRDPANATATMRQVYKTHEQDIEVRYELELLRTELAASTKSLKKETPSTLTNENAAAVKHLRERKRKLLADTIKAVVHMGVRRNLATAELERQSTTALVLADTPAFSDASGEWRVANQAFHELLDSMPQARATLMEHSPDLTDGEVRRGLGLLEGLLFIVGNQRKRQSTTSTQIHALEVSTKMLQSICNLSSDLKISNSTAAETSLQQRLSWFAVILDIACNILDFQAENADIDLTVLREALHGTAAWLRTEQNEYVEVTRASTLPDALSIQSSEAWREIISQRLQKFGDELRQWCVKEPNVAYLLKQLISWTEWPQQKIRTRLKSGFLGTVDIDELTRKTVDSVFVALQGLLSVKMKAPISFEDEGWLVQNDKHLQELTETLHITTISRGLGEIMASIGHLKDEELPLTVSLLKVAAPILEQFLLICQHLQQKQVAIHLETCRLACFLAKSFATLAKDGYCSPAEPSDGKEQPGQLESGTGLGEGEGAEDISKDVGADEDMNEFAQSGEKREEDGDMSDVEDAVDLGAEELVGEMGEERESKDKDEDDDSGDGESGDEVDEEAGSVDDLDPSAVDEKMWDGAAKEAEEKEKDLKSEKPKGQKGQDQTEKPRGEAEGENEGEVEEGEANEEEIEDEDVGATKAEAENADPHLQDENALELPDEMQLNGEEEKAEDEISDTGLDELSDIEQSDGEADEVEQVDQPDVYQDKPATVADTESVQDEADSDTEGIAGEDEIMEKQSVQDEDEQDHAEREGDISVDQEGETGGEVGQADQLQDDIDSNQNNQGQNEVQQADNDQKPLGGKAPKEQDQGQSGRGTVERGTGRDDQGKRPQDEPLRRLADVLEKWHQRREILNPQEDRQDGQIDDDVDMADADFEHIDDDDEEADTQALGAAGADQAQNLDPSKTIQDKETSIEDDIPMPDAQETEPEDPTQDRLNRLQASSALDRKDDNSSIPSQPPQHPTQPPNLNPTIDASLENTTTSIHNITLTNPPTPPPTDTTSALSLWTYCSTQVHTSSLTLTEQLRLILSPTTATKLRGDYRTGKRLNLKRIIPYIASGYKRDKIWMRRSVPSKRNYQVLLAVDDSKSMSDSNGGSGGADLLALQTTALLTKSLSMLEVGDIAVIAFGDKPDITIAHDFGTPWTFDSGVEVFRHFSFQQKGTNVMRMVSQSLDMLREARLKSNVSNAADLWQLQLIISDGHCSDHDGIRRLVRQAKEERVVMVFVIVDNANTMEGGEDGMVKESILDLKEAVFEPDTREGREGEMRVVTRRYLERFPFEYYLVVRDVRDLPGVLSRCLKGWMESVVET